MLANYGSLGLVIGIGIVALLLFIVIKFFKALFSVSFIGLICSLVSYFVYDYKFATVPVLAALGLVFSLTGMFKSGIFGKVFAVFGTLISGYIILTNYGII